MKNQLLFSLSLVIISSAAFSQSLRENLDYVNEQFGKYNSHDIVFNIDTDYKALVIFDNYGTTVCYFEDVEFDLSEESKNIIEIRCIDDEECFDQKKNEEDFTLEKWTAELDGGNLNKILAKLNEIKKIVLEED